MTTLKKLAAQARLAAMAGELNPQKGYFIAYGIEGNILHNHDPIFGPFILPEQASNLAKKDLGKILDLVDIITKL